MNIVEKLVKTIILGISVTILTFSLNAARSSFNGGLYPKMITLELDDVNEVELKEKLRKIGPKLEILEIDSDRLIRFNLANLEYLQKITLDCSELTDINIINCKYLQQIYFFGPDTWLQNIKIKDCPLLQHFAISDSDINDQQLKKLLSLVKDRLSILHLFSCKNLQDIDLKIYPNLELLSLDDCPGLQQNIEKLRATGIEIEIFGF